MEAIIAKLISSDLITGRKLKVRLKTAKGRKISSTRWLERQLNDPFVQQAKLEGYRSRSAFKILELNEKFQFLTAGARVLDLGCAPGGWSQIAAKKTNSTGTKKNKNQGFVLAIDLKEVEPMDGVQVEKLDFQDNDAEKKVKKWMGQKVNVVMSDMAPASSGHKKTDHLRIVNLCEMAAYFAFEVLETGGTFIAKVLAGGAESELQKVLKNNFSIVANVKPISSRSDSSEKFVVAKGFRL
jgi:23S rRNA (uridine2552-2'-O)-methyltransferase